MTPPRYVPALPFVNWLNREEHDRKIHDVAGSLGDKLGVSDQSLYRYRKSLDGNNDPTDLFHRASVEDLLHRAGVAPWEIGGYAKLFNERVKVREGFLLAL